MHTTWHEINKCLWSCIILKSPDSYIWGWEGIDLYLIQTMMMWESFTVIGHSNRREWWDPDCGMGMEVLSGHWVWLWFNRKETVAFPSLRWSEWRGKCHYGQLHPAFGPPHAHNTYPSAPDDPLHFTYLHHHLLGTFLGHGDHSFTPLSLSFLNHRWFRSLNYLPS